MYEIKEYSWESFWFPTHFLYDESKLNFQIWFVHVTHDMFYDKCNTVCGSILGQYISTDVPSFALNAFGYFGQTRIIPRHSSSDGHVKNEFATSWNAGINWPFSAWIVVVLTSNS